MRLIDVSSNINVKIIQLSKGVMEDSSIMKTLRIDDRPATLA